MPANARFIEPMLLLRAEKLPDGAEWLIELKLDGYRALAIKAAERFSSVRATTTISTSDTQEA